VADALLLGSTVAFAAATAYATAVAIIETDLVGEPFGLHPTWPNSLPPRHGMGLCYLVHRGLWP
jgi:hypothetical protein